MENEFIVIVWPEIQDLMDEDGFEYNCCLINDDPFIQEYGNSAYFVRKTWLESINVNN